jgi:putative MATE family efflux protein
MEAGAISYKHILNISLPIVLSGVAQNIVNVTDTAFLGRLGKIELGAAGNAGLFYFVFVMLGMGMSTGSQIIIGRRNGEKNYAQVGAIFNHTLFLMIPLGIIMFLLLYYISPVIFESFTNSVSISKASISYMNYRSPGILFALFNFVFISYFVGTTRTNILTYSTLLMALTNVFFDYVLIFGELGFPEMGVKGAALASVIAEITTLLFFIIYSRWDSNKVKYNMFRFGRLNKELVSRIIKISAPVMMQNTLALGSWFIFFMILEKLGESELAVSHIIRSIYMVLIIPLMGLNVATNTLVSNLIGAGKSAYIGDLLKKIIVLCLAFTTVLLGLIWIAPEQVILLYTNDISLVPLSISTLKIISMTIYVFCVASILFNGVIGTGNTKVTMAMEFINIFIYLTTTYYMTVILQLRLELVWCSEFIYFSVLGIMAYWYLKKGNWRKTIV